jgi:hypothetical protein
MISKIGSGRLTLVASLLLLSRPTDVLAQLVFSNVPSTLNEGQEVQISWTGWDGVSVSVISQAKPAGHPSLTKLYSP